MKKILKKALGGYIIILTTIITIEIIILLGKYICHESIDIIFHLKMIAIVSFILAIIIGLYTIEIYSFTEDE